MILAARLMLAKGCLHGFDRQITCLCRPTIEPNLSGEIAKTTYEPISQRKLESLFRPIQNASRQPGLDRLADDIFAGRTLQLQIERHSRRPINKLVRQEGH